MIELLGNMDFGNEAGDDISNEEIENSFVEQKLFSQILNSKSRILILSGKKGIGKSILIKWLKYRHSKEKGKNQPIVITLRGADLTREQFALKNVLETPNDYIHDWMKRLCAIANRKIAEIIKFAYTDNEMSIIETAELQGFKEKNLISSLLSRIPKILPIISGLPVETNSIQILNEIETLKRVKNRFFYFLIDDLDATFQNSEKEKIELSTFFSACRYLTQDIKDVFFRVTMRTDVWPIIKRYDESLDKIAQYVREIKWDTDDFRRLLFKRILPQLPHSLQVKSSSSTEEEMEEEIISKIFSNKMKWGTRQQYTYKVIHTLSYGRPRWGIQLCKLAKEIALKKKSLIIDKEHIDLVWGEYGKKRVSDLVSEHKHQCAQIEEIINGFRGCDRLLSKEELFRLIKSKILTHIPPIIEGNEYKKPGDIGNFLFRIGFIVGRSDEIINDEGDKQYEHYHYEEMPDLLTGRTSDDFNFKWEIHPCYREALDIKKINNFKRIARTNKN